VLGIDPTDREWNTIWVPSVFGQDLVTVSKSEEWVDDYVTIK
jgi:hypothetical protein